MSKHRISSLHCLPFAAPAAALAFAQPALADTAPLVAPLQIAPGTTLAPLVDARLRWEDVDQPATDADAVTLRVRGGLELKNAPSHLSLLAEADGTVALDKDYSAFPFATTNSQKRPAYSTVSDPETLQLNRLQVAYQTKYTALTVGRQRINLDDERFVGSSGWRQNEQTFNAVRGVQNFAALGVPVTVDLTYSDLQHTVWGQTGTRDAYHGQFWFIGAGAKLGPVNLKAFSYLLDYDPTAFTIQNNSSQTYGLRATTVLPLSKVVKLSLAGSYARQSSYGTTPFHFAADYAAAEGKLGAYGLTGTLGYELLGSDRGLHAVQTPMATLHKFNGWADIFLAATPNAGLQDLYGGLAYGFPMVKAVKGLTAQVIYHQYDAAHGSARYGHEIDSALGFKTGPVGWLVKYADYTARGFGTNTRKIWLEADFSL